MRDAMAPTEADIDRLGPRPPQAADYLLTAGLAGAGGALAVLAALPLLALAEGRAPLQPVNATSHVLYGPRAGARHEADVAHTGVGSVVNAGASLFWALPFSWWLLRRRRTPAAIAAGAAGTAALAAAVDYGLMPRRLTPGWEHAVSRGAVGATFAALALGLSAGALAARAIRAP
jgi:hypothetical protein